MKLFTPDGSEMMNVSAIKTEGDNLIVVGTIMGAMPVETVLTPAELRSAFKIFSVKHLLFVVRMLFKR